MKFKPKHALAAVALAIAGQASAQVIHDLPGTGNSSMYFIALDEVLGRSYFTEMVANAGSTTTGILHMDDLVSNPSGTWTFSQDQPFDYDNPAIMANLKGATRFTASFPGLIRAQPHHYFQYYAEDEWKMAAGLTLNLGIRYDLDTEVWNKERKNDLSWYPKILPYVNFANRGDNNNVSPRLGMAWDVRNDGKNVVRAGYGRLYNMIMNGTPGAETTTLLQTSISIANPTYPDPYGGRSPAMALLS